jgi:hypothetical protein
MEYAKARMLEAHLGRTLSIQSIQTEDQAEQVVGADTWAAGRKCRCGCKQRWRLCAGRRCSSTLSLSGSAYSEVNNERDNDLFLADR